VKIVPQATGIGVAADFTLDEGVTCCMVQNYKEYKAIKKFNVLSLGAEVSI